MALLNSSAASRHVFYYLEGQTAEAFLPTPVSDRPHQNVQLIGYRGDGPVAATTTSFLVPRRAGWRHHHPRSRDLPRRSVRRNRERLRTTLPLRSPWRGIGTAAARRARERARPHRPRRARPAHPLAGKNFARASFRSVAENPGRNPALVESAADARHYRTVTDAQGVTALCSALECTEPSPPDRAAIVVAIWRPSARRAISA
jgi:hypothetical protein